MTVLVLCVAFVWFLKQVQVAFFSDLSPIPNAHFTVPLSRLWILHKRWKNRQNRARLAAHQKLGPVVRIGPRELSVNCIDDGVRTIYGSAFDKDAWYAKAFRGHEKPYMFTMISSKAHAERKRMFANVYSKSYIQKSSRWSEMAYTIISGRLRDEMISWADSDIVVDVLERSKACLMDLTSAWIFGLKHGTNFIQNVKEAEEFFTPFRRTFGGFFWRTLEQTLSMELLDHMVAGHDATGITVTYLLYEISQRSSLQRRLKIEIQAHWKIGQKNCAEQLEKLPLLDAVLMETLRLYSANLGPWPRVAPSSIRLGKFSNIPKGTIISASSYALHKNDKVFPCPEKWLPERWLDASETQRKEMMRWFWAFGSGSRMCIGSHLAIYSKSPVSCASSGVLSANAVQT
ncbi:cytochrome P450 [Mollisia scopiformis]|uniref:Cytochrome P450 n=1 Tax=Mollisia scopiformis TaxID=149040 RepID=A0A194X5E2_MOLSC|nr:cytochrome P450 [Mollisia scopiformis]KUJ15032.1 cytochrome P450 [Mollisia scopiformis]